MLELPLVSIGSSGGDAMASNNWASSNMALNTNKGGLVSDTGHWGGDGVLGNGNSWGSGIAMSNGWGSGIAVSNGWGGGSIAVVSSIADGWGSNSSVSDGTSGNGRSGNGRSGNGWGGNCRTSSIANWAKGTAATSCKVVSLSSSHSRLIIRGDSTIGMNPQAKGSSSKALGTSPSITAGIAVTVGVSTIMACLSGGNGSGNSNLKPAKANENITTNFRSQKKKF